MPATKAPTPTEVFLDSVAKGLNAAGIPCVLWGHFLWKVHGVPTGVFVSPAFWNPAISGPRMLR
jgi:hypothetical protein